MRHDRKTKTARYYNSNGFAVAIVAVVDYYDNELFDWTAYIGGTDRTWLEQDAVDWATEHGHKLRTQDARYYFPNLPPERCR